MEYSCNSLSSDLDCTTIFMIMEVAETACYFGASLSALIAQRIFRMYEKTFINKMFLWYFAVDAIMGTLNTFSLFRVQRFVKANNYNDKTCLSQRTPQQELTREVRFYILSGTPRSA